MDFAYVFRGVTIALVFLACWLLPKVLLERFPTHRVWLIVLLVEVQFIGAAIAVGDASRSSHPMVWYRTPRIFVSAVIALAYVWLARRDRRERRVPPRPVV